jgi:hypothetical protein
MDMKTYIFHTDAGHGWLAVKRQELIDLGVMDRITSFSYQRGKTVYLEEDCDATTFVNAYEKRYGHEIKTTSRYHWVSPIRSYQAFRNEEE